MLLNCKGRGVAESDGHAMTGRKAEIALQCNEQFFFK